MQIISSDHLKNVNEFKNTFNKIVNGKIDVVIGTQIIAKGHNFPLLSFVGIIDIDVALQGGDIRATEKTFQLLRQVVGRSGRFDVSGEAIIQTYQPKNQLIQMSTNYQSKQFYNLSLDSRKALNYPPFKRLIAIIISSKE